MQNICDWGKCNKVANFKAPTEKDNSKKYKWLCKEHIKLFNEKWDYFNGMTQGEIEIFLKSDSTWHRPTQKFGSPNNFFRILWNNALGDKFKIFDESEKNGIDTSCNLSSKDRKAFETLDLKPGSGWSNIQKKFKTLVKKFHPDMNAGSTIYEDKLKTITIAYQRLKLIIKENKNGKS